MTNREAVVNAVQVTGYSEGAVDKAIIDFDIAPNEQYGSTQKLLVNKAALQVLKGMLAVARVSEGDYTLEYSVEGIQARIADLNEAIGISGKPVIRNKSYLW